METLRVPPLCVSSVFPSTQRAAELDELQGPLGLASCGDSGLGRAWKPGHPASFLRRPPLLLPLAFMGLIRAGGPGGFCYVPFLSLSCPLSILNQGHGQGKCRNPGTGV